MLRLSAILLILLGMVSTGCNVSTGGGGGGTGNGDSDTNDPTAMQVMIGATFESATRTGTGSGEQEVAICEGFFPNQPNHIIDIEASQTMTVRLTSDSPVRLWILMGESNFCGEGEATPEISRFWNRGEAEVYVGTPEEDQTADYTLDFTAD